MHGRPWSEQSSNFFETKAKQCQRNADQVIENTTECHRTSSAARISIEGVLVYSRYRSSAAACGVQLYFNAILVHRNRFLKVIILRKYYYRPGQMYVFILKHTRGFGYKLRLRCLPRPFFKRVGAAEIR